MPKTSILIVEDEQIVALDIQTSLENAGYTVTGRADRGESAIQKAQELRPDLVLMDIGLKGQLDGIDAAIQIREKFDIPVIFLTAFANHSTMERARLAQPYGYMLKPFDERELISNIEMALYKHNMEAKLRESEARFRRLADNALDIIFRYEVSPSMRLTYINPTVETIMGYTPDECYADPMLMLNMIHPEDRGLMLGIVQTLTLPSEPLFARWLDKYGTVHWMESRIVSVFDTSGQLIAAEGITRDITGRKQAEEAVSNSEKRFRALIENGRDNISVLAADGTLLWENPTTKSTLGYDPNQFIGHNIFELMHPDDMEWTRQMYLRVVAEPGHTEEGMFRLLGSNGSWLWIEATATNLLDEPKVRGIVINYRDVTERRHLSESLQHSRDLLLALSRASQAVLKAGTDEEIYRAVGAQIQSLGFDTTVLTIDPDGQHLAIRYTTFAEQLLRAGEKMAGASLHDFRLSFSQDSALGRIIVSGTGQYSDQISALIAEADPKILSPLTGQLQRLLKIEQAIAVPLRVEEETLGIFTIGGAGLSKDDIPAVEIFTAQLGISLHNARLTQQLHAELGERKQTEQTLRESEARYRRLVEGAPDVVYTFSNKRGGIYYSPHVEQVLGYSVEYLYAHPFLWNKSIHPNDQTKISQIISKLEIGKPYDVEYRIQDAQGKWLWLRDQSIGYHITDDEVLAEGLAIDITEGKLAELKIIEARNQLEATLEAIPDLLFELGLDGRYYSYHSPRKDLLAASPEVFLGKTIYEILPVDAAEVVNAGLKDANEKGYSIGKQLKLQLPSGLFWFELSIARKANLPGQDTHFIVMSRDITRRKQMEETLIETENRYRETIEFAVDGILIGSHEGVITSANSCMLKLAGRTLDEIVGLHISVLFSPDELISTPLRFDLLLQGETVINQRNLVRPDGKVIPIEMHTKMMPNGTYQSIYRDITERKQAEEALRESQSLYHSLVEVAPLSICRKDLAGRFTFANRHFLALSNHTLADIIGKTDFDLHPAELAEKYRRDDQAILASGQVRELIEPRTVLGAETTFVQSIKVPIYDGNGKINGIQISFWDITERRRAEVALSESEERLRLSLQAAHQGLYDLNVQTGAAIVNREYAEMLDYDPETFVETNAAWVERMHPDDRELAAQTYSDYIHGLKPEYRVEYRQKTLAGNWKWILSLGKVVEYSAPGKPLRLVGTHTDISERKQAEAEVYKLTQAVKQSASVIVVTDVEGKIEYANPKFTEITGYSLPEALGQNPRILCSGEHTPRFYQNLWQTIKSGKIWQGEFHNRRKDGSLYWEDATIAPVLDPNGRIINFIAVKEDITARKALEAAERDQRQLAEALRDTALALSSTLKLDDILDRILDNIGKLVKYDVAMVSLVEGNAIRKIRYHSNPENEFNQLPMRDVQANLINIPIWNDIIQLRQSSLIPDILADDRWQSVAIAGMQRIRSLLCVPIESHDNVVGVINIISATPDFFTPLQAERITIFASQAAVAIENARMFERTQRLALTDALTELYNMRYFNEFASLEVDRTHRNKRTLCIAMIDLDHFKRINDTHGHGIGDLVLREVAARIRNAVRTVDIIARYGGEEFVILLPETGLEAAFQVADRIRLAVAGSPFEYKNVAVSLTLSLGVAEMHPAARSLDELIQCADQAMYSAKAAGRNRVGIYQAE